MVPDATRLAHLAPPQRAAFAVAARLISCLVTESLLYALYFHSPGPDASGFALILLHDPSAEPAPSATTCQIADALAVVPLRSAPIISDHKTGLAIKEITLLDPLDMVPLSLVFSEYQSNRSSYFCRDNNQTSLTVSILDALHANGWFIQSKVQLDVCWDPISLWRVYARYANLSSDLTEDVAGEFSSSLKWQEYSYQHPPTAPAFNSPSIEWEQSIVEGHPTHPMHKLRYFLPPIPDYAPGTYDLYRAKLRLVSISKDQLKITNDFEKYVEPIIEAAARRAGIRPVVPANHIIVPVHELQTMHIRHKFPDIEILPPEFAVPFQAQQSIRSVQVSDAYVDLSLKLGVGIKLTSAVRTISPASAYLGPRFSTQVVPHLNLDPTVVTVAKELASVVHVHPDAEIAKHCSIIIREAHENTSERRGERLIVCTALVESGHSGEDGHLPAVVRVFQLNTEERRLHWLDRYVEVLFQAFLPSVISNGVAFECHPQNCLARFDMKTKELRGFIIRDFGGLRIHPETLYAATGVKLDCLPGHSIVAPDLDDVYTRMYHSVIHNHLQQLIRVLGLHYNGQGWKIVRTNLMKVIPKEHGLYAAWLSPESKTLPSKCFLRMRMAGMYRFHLHSPVPNLILCGASLMDHMC